MDDSYCLLPERISEQFSEIDSDIVMDLAAASPEYPELKVQLEELKRRKAAILSIRQEQEQIGRRIHAAASAMTAVTMGITEWDDGVVYQILEKVTVLADNRIEVTFRNGVEIEQTVDQPKRGNSYDLCDRRLQRKFCKV